VHMADNRTIVNEEKISDTAQSFPRLPFVRANRLVAQVAAGGDDRKTKFSHEQMMQRIRRQHHAEIRIAWGDGICDSRFPTSDFPQQHNRRFRRTQPPLLQWRYFANVPRAFQRWNYERERLFLAVLSFAQKPDGHFIARIRQQMKSANAL